MWKYYLVCQQDERFFKRCLEVAPTDVGGHQCDLVGLQRRRLSDRSLVDLFLDQGGFSVVVCPCMVAASGGGRVRVSWFN